MTPWLIVTVAVPAVVRMSSWLAAGAGHLAPVALAVVASAGGVVWMRLRPRRSTAPDVMDDEAVVPRQVQPADPVSSSRS